MEISSKDSLTRVFLKTNAGLYLLTLSHDNPVTLMHRKRDIAKLTSFYLPVDMLNDSK